jgi:DHA2 family multidrug resistance protein
MSAGDGSGGLPRAALSASARTLLTVAVMAATVMQVLDSTIVNVSLPHMQGQLGATSDEISWVLTSYLVSSAIMLPLTGFFSDRLGRKRFLMFAIGGFVVASMACGIAQSLSQIVLFRLAQGVVGAGLVPLSQAILVDIYPSHERARAMSIWSMGVMVGPILGPTLGGYLTEVLSWRWNFFINLPIGILTLLLVAKYCPASPRRERSMDWVGLVLLSLAIAGLQVVLDRGNGDDWFSSNLIITCSVLAVVCLAGFIVHSLTTTRHPVFDLSVLRNRNFLAAGLVTTLMTLGMFGSTFVQPILLEKMLDYPTTMTGLVMGPRGIATLISMNLAGRAIGRFDIRLIVSFGILVSGIGSLRMSHYSPDIDAFSIMLPGALQGLGMGFIFVPLATLQLSTLRQEQTAEGAGLASLMRALGQSLGISIIATLLSRFGQTEWAMLGGHLNPYNPALQAWLAHNGLQAGDPMAVTLLSLQLGQQSQMLALINIFKFVGWACLAMLLFVPLVKPMPRSAVESGPHEPLVIE